MANISTETGGYTHRCRNGIIAKECPACQYAMSRTYGHPPEEAQRVADALADALAAEQADG